MTTSKHATHETKERPSDSMKTTDYLIVGNSASGVTAAETIRETDKESTITIVSREPYHVYGRPLISYMIEGKTSEQNIGFKPDGFYEKNRIETLFGKDFEVTRLKPQEHCVVFATGEQMAYRKCLIATGSNPFTPPIKGLIGPENVFPFITLDDAKGAWREAERVTKAAHEEGRRSRLVVVGAGLIGLKAAEALSYHVDDVLVLELAPRILPAVLDDKGGKILQGLLEPHGIVCMPTVSAEEFHVKDNRVVGAQLTNGEEITCDMVIAAVGVRPNTAFVVEAGAAEGRGLVCDECLQTSLPDVFAAGDVVQVTDVLDGSQKPLALWPNALVQGRIAGAQMAQAANAEEFKGSFAVNAVDFFEVSLLTAGIINPVEVERCDIRETATENQYTKFVIVDGCLKGYILLNRPENAGIYTAVIDAGIPLSELGENFLTDPPQNLEFTSEARWERLHKCYPSNFDRLGRKEQSA